MRRNRERIIDNLRSPVEMDWLDEPQNTVHNIVVNICGIKGRYK
jgi:hypothetical protein